MDKVYKLYLDFNEKYSKIFINMWACAMCRYSKLGCCGFLDSLNTHLNDIFRMVENKKVRCTWYEIANFLMAKYMTNTIAIISARL